MAQSTSETMRSVGLHEFGGVDKLFIDEHTPRPVPGSGEALVRVQATALNRADVLQRMGRYPVPPGESEILGLEFSGVIDSFGPDQAKESTFQVGDRVCALLGGGGYAQYVAVPTSMLMRVPDNVSFSAAAAFPEAFLTAFQALFWIGGLSPESKEANQQKRVLIHAGASGVGSSAIQLARLAGVKQIIVTAGSEEKLAFCKELGADEAINYKTNPDFSVCVNELTAGEGVHVLIDFVGQSYWNNNLNSLAIEGKMVMLGFLSGFNLPAGSSIGAILRKRLQIEGSTLRARSLEYKVALTRALESFAGEAFRSGTVKPIISKEFPFTEVAAAHTFMEENRNLGKIVLNA
eukprot:CAMPEP_0174244692 /NCGR_PEP_ID=MMETSP0417-20130205/36221_1 /TAXON_ID=242541 /ORGANISM="Mayorella sp, Strain BSH-02190019" /LENGTH=348 /DNA_ID=CAMNT_0015324405 /DNA_START=236 /DNA_END=1278 /DNA_ORIENTATION=-